MNNPDVIGEDVKVFKDIVDQLVELSGESTEHVISLLLKTKYQYIMQEASMAEIAYVYGVTKQRIEQIIRRVIGKKEMPTKGRTKAQMPSKGGLLQSSSKKEEDKILHEKVMKLRRYLDDFDMQTINKTIGVSND